jgi:hypothetical protein
MTATLYLRQYDMLVPDQHQEAIYDDMFPLVRPDPKLAPGDHVREIAKAEALKIIGKKNQKRLKANGATDVEYCLSLVPVVYLADDNGASWLLAAMYDDIAFGLIDVGYGQVILGGVRLSDIGLYMSRNPGAVEKRKLTDTDASSVHWLLSLQSGYMNVN